MSDETLRPTEPLQPIDPDSTIPLTEEERVVSSVGPGKIIEGKWRYKLGKRLGQGGFGSVFKAECLNADCSNPKSPPQTVAVKVFHAPNISDASSLLKRELLALLAMKHPRIPRVYDWAMGHELAYVVLKFYEKGSLQDLWRYMPKLETEMAWRLLMDLLTALNAAHRAAILHMDIKPANVLLDDDGGFALTDFGISQGVLVPWHIIAPGMGTRGYHSPEQRRLADDEVDGRTDLWGVGATVWALYTGIDLSRNVELYQGALPGAEFGLPPLTRYREDCPRELEDVVMSLLRLSPADRPGGAAEVLGRIRHLRGESRLSAESYKALVSAVATSDEFGEVIESMIDPLWIDLCKSPGYDSHLVKFDDGQLIARQGDESYHTYVLLKGRMRIERNGEAIATETREGAFIGEIATLTGRQRTASVIAEGIVYALVFNAAELERVVSFNPAIGIRMIHTMAERLADDRLGKEER